MLKRILAGLFCGLLVSLTIAACAGGGKNDVAGEGNAGRGKKLYEQTVLGPNVAPGCVTCHSLKPGVILVGPSHAGLATKAGSIVPGQSAEGYLRESILEPDAYVVEGFAPGIMYQNFGKDLSEQEINDLVAYMLTLK